MSHLEENATRANETRGNNAVSYSGVQNPKKATNQVEKHQIRKHTHIQEAEGPRIQKIKLFT